MTQQHVAGAVQKMIGRRAGGALFCAEPRRRRGSGSGSLSRCGKRHFIGVK